MTSFSITIGKVLSKKKTSACKRVGSACKKSHVSYKFVSVEDCNVCNYHELTNGASIFLRFVSISFLL